MPSWRDPERPYEELEELLADLWRGPRFAAMRRAFRPRIDIFRTDGAAGEPSTITVVVELAGIDPEEVELVLLDRTLVIAGRREPPHGEGPRSYYQLEIENGPFARKIALAEDVSVKTARATYVDGLLTIVLPIAQRPRRDVRVSIPVKGSPS